MDCCKFVFKNLTTTKFWTWICLSSPITNKYVYVYKYIYSTYIWSIGWYKLHVSLITFLHTQHNMCLQNSIHHPSLPRSWQPKSASKCARERKNNNNNDCEVQSDQFINTRMLHSLEMKYNTLHHQWWRLWKIPKKSSKMCLQFIKHTRGIIPFTLCWGLCFKKIFTYETRFLFV